MSFMVFYFGVMLIDMACDGALCVVAKRRYRFWPSLAACSVWPITAPIEIAGAVVATKDYEQW